MEYKKITKHSNNYECPFKVMEKKKKMKMKMKMKMKDDFKIKGPEGYWSI